MMGLGHMGLGDAGRAKESFAKALVLAPGHQGVLCHQAMLEAAMRPERGM